jgi:disulfide bond formation protein DsbB
MQETILLLNFLLALAGIGVVCAAFILLFDLVSKNHTFAPLLKTWWVAVACVVSLGASAMTLLYSEVFGFVPCGLCWLQRVFLYPQVVILALTLKSRSTQAAVYGIALSLLGTVVALYQHYLQMGGTELIGCPTAGSGVNCADRFMFEFGFVTFPLLSAFLFVFLIALYVYVITLSRKDTDSITSSSV